MAHHFFLFSGHYSIERRARFRLKWCIVNRRSKYIKLYNTCADVAQLVERRLAKAKVAGSRPVVRSIYVPLAQLDRAFDYESKGREFESLRARHYAGVVQW